MFRRLFVAAVGMLGVLATQPAAATTTSGADLTVGLDAEGSLILSGAYYTVSVTNTVRRR
jgi:hypothetical protein